MKSVFGRCPLTCPFPPLTSLPSIPPSLAWNGEEGRPPPAAPKRQRAHHPETLGLSQTPSKLQFLHPILHHPSPVLVGCSLGLRANKRLCSYGFECATFSILSLGLLAWMSAGFNSSAKEDKSKIIKQCSHGLMVTQQLGLAPATGSTLA